MSSSFNLWRIGPVVSYPYHSGMINIFYENLSPFVFENLDIPRSRSTSNLRTVQRDRHHAYQHVTKLQKSRSPITHRIRHFS